MINAKEEKFLLDLKDKGYSQEKATNALNMMRQKDTMSAKIATEKISGSISSRTPEVVPRIGNAGYSQLTPEKQQEYKSADKITAEKGIYKKDEDGNIPMPEDTPFQMQKPSDILGKGLDSTVGKIPFVGEAIADTAKNMALPITKAHDIAYSTAGALKEGFETVQDAGTEVGEAISGIDIETGKDMTASERVIRAGSGLADLTSGGLGVAFAPITGIINELPEFAKKGVEYPFEKVNEASLYASENFKKWSNIEEGTEQAEAIDKLFSNLGNLLVIEASSKISKSKVPLKVKTNVIKGAEIAMPKLAEFSKDIISKVEKYAERKSIVKDVKQQAMDTLKDSKQSIKLDKIGEIYRDTLKPTQGEVKLVEIKGKKSIDDLYKLAAEEELLIKMTKDGKLDTKSAITQLAPKKTEVYNLLDEALQSKPEKVFDLNQMKETIKTKIRKEIKNDTEYKKMIKDIDRYIDDAISERGQVVNGANLNNLKQGMWEVSFDQLRPTSKVAAREIGNVAKNMIEDYYTDSNIKGLNELSGKYLALESLLENANGRVVKGGKLGSYFAKTGGSIIGSAIPIVGSIGGWFVGEKFHNYMMSPERITSKAIKQVQEIKKSQPIKTVSEKAMN